MLIKRVVKIALISLIVILTGCGAEAASVPTTEPVAPATATGIIVLGDISDEPAKKIDRFQPLANHLAANLNEFGIGVGEVKIAPDIETMAEWLAAGDVDLYFDSPYPAMIVSDQSGAQPVLRRWKDGDAEYHTIFFTRADSDLTSLDDIQGQVIALEEVFSTSGYMLPMAHLIETGLNPVEKDEPEATVTQNEIGYVFSGDDENTIQWVLSHKVIAGATDSQSFQFIPEETRAGLTVLAETEPVARQVVVARPGLDAAQLDAVKALLIDLEKTEAGQAILEKNRTAKFDEFPKGAEAALTRMRDLYQLVTDR